MRISALKTMNIFMVLGITIFYISTAITAQAYSYNLSASGVPGSMTPSQTININYTCTNNNPNSTPENTIGVKVLATTKNQTTGGNGFQQNGSFQDVGGNTYTAADVDNYSQGFGYQASVNGTLTLIPSDLSAGHTATVRVICSTGGSAISAPIDYSISVVAPVVEQPPVVQQPTQPSPEAPSDTNQNETDTDEDEKITDLIKAPVNLESKTLSNLSDSDTSINSLDITDPETNNSVVFNTSFDLTDETIQEKINEIEDYIEFGEGYVDVDSNNFPELNTTAEITINFEIENEENIRIYKDGEDATLIVSDLSYDEESETVSFNVEGFSKYEVREEDQSNNDEYVSTKDNDSTILLVAVILIIILLIASSASFVYYKKRKSKSAVVKESKVVETTTAEIPS